MWIWPSVTRNTCFGSSRFVSFNQGVRPSRFLPLKSGVASFGVTGSSAAAAVVTAIAKPKAARGRNMAALPGLNTTGRDHTRRERQNHGETAGTRAAGTLHSPYPAE